MRNVCPQISNWQAQIVFTDGTSAFFDGAKDMFKYLFDLRRYNSRKSRGDIAAFWVTDYYTTKWIDGKRAHYVVGRMCWAPWDMNWSPTAARRPPSLCERSCRREDPELQRSRPQSRREHEVGRSTVTTIVGKRGRFRPAALFLGALSSPRWPLFLLCPFCGHPDWRRNRLL